MEQIEVVTHLIPFQKRFVPFGPPSGKQARFLVHGGRGSGKSEGGALKTMFLMLKYPGIIGIVTAPTMGIAKASTLQAVRNVWNRAGFLEGQDYEFVQNRDEFSLPNGSKFFLRSTDDPEHLRGMNAAFFWMDEARDSPFAAYTNLSLSIRQQGFPHMGWITTTPSGKRHWLHQTFWEHMAEQTDTIYRTFAAHTLDNPYGGKELYDSNIDLLGGPDAPLARQELCGEFVVMEGLVYPSFDEKIHIVPESEWPDRNPLRVIGGIDFGWSAPSAILAVGFQPNQKESSKRGEPKGTYYLMDEFYGSHLTEGDIAFAAHDFMDKYGIRSFACDSAEPRVIKALRSEGVPAYGVNKHNTMAFKIAACNSVLNAKDPDGKQLFYASPKMVHWAREMGNYVYKADRQNSNPMEMPRELEDHAIDAWGYATIEIMRMFAGKNPTLRIMENIKIG
jgi:PBSX family phage terminase large subunit